MCSTQTTPIDPGFIFYSDKQDWYRERANFTLSASGAADAVGIGRNSRNSALMAKILCFLEAKYPRPVHRIKPLLLERIALLVNNGTISLRELSSAFLNTGSMTPLKDLLL